MIYWDQGTNTFIELIGETSQYTGTDYTLTTGIVTGTTYKFKIKAVNKWGAGTFSALNLSVLAASVPDKVATPTTSIYAADGGVKILWVAPNARGSTISSYLIQLKDKLG